MDSNILLAVFQIIRGSIITQFYFLARLITLLASIIISGYLYSYYFGRFNVVLTMDMFAQTCFSAKTVYAVLFFCFIYFGFYPFIGVTSMVLYRITFRNRRKMSKRGNRNLMRGFESSGILNVLDILPNIQLLALYRKASVDILDGENKLIISLSYIWITLLMGLFYLSSVLYHRIVFFAFSIVFLVILTILMFKIVPLIFILISVLIDGLSEKIKGIDSEHQT